MELFKVSLVKRLYLLMEKSNFYPSFYVMIFRMLLRSCGCTLCPLIGQVTEKAIQIPGELLKV
jgi:hypothetical protein